MKKRGPRSPPREEARWYYPARLAAPGPVQMAFSGSAGGEQRMFKAGRQGERGMGAAATPGIKGGLGVDPGSDPHRRRFATERPRLKATAAGQRRHHGKWGKSRARGATPDLARQAGVDGPNPDQPRPTAFMRINPTVKPTGYPVHIDYSTPMPTRYTSPYPTAYNTQPTPLPTAAPAVTASKQTKNPPTKNPMPTRPKSPVPTTAPAR